MELELINNIDSIDFQFLYICIKMFCRQISFLVVKSVLKSLIKLYINDSESTFI